MTSDLGPQDGPGYERARADGMLPDVPAAPPELLAGPTADQLCTRVLLYAAGAFVGFFVVAKVGSGVLDGLPTAVAAGAIGAAGLAMLAWLYRGWGRVGVRNLQELQRGYTTLTLTAGAFRRGVTYRWPGTGDRIGWDYRGVWVLGNDGAIKQHPDTDILPPGLYPTPNHETLWEIWSGRVWTGDFRPPLSG